MAAHATSFGGQVRTLRVAAGLTQAELAERSGISERTISDLERGVRATSYSSTARRLASALHVTDPDAASFFAQARASDRQDIRRAKYSAPVASADRFRLPIPLTRLVDREVELALLLELVRDPEQRLVTLLGSGGIGKTRLAVEVAARTREFFGDTYFVNLSDANDPAMVLPAIAGAIGLQPVGGELSSALARRLGDSQVLLVLDTFEAIVAAAPAIGELVMACRGLTVLVTSRTALRLRGEREVLLRPLAVGDPGVVDTSPAAVRLFLERAGAVAPGLADTAAAMQVIREICVCVDGIPLAIELAAARVKHMPLVDLLRRLDRRLDFLVDGARDLPARQQTMRAAIDWSYHLLGLEEQRLFRGLAAFRGGFSEQAVDAVAGRGGTPPVTDVMPALSSLIDASVVLVETGSSGRARYRLLDVLREYAAEGADKAGEIDGLRRRHADHFLTLAERAEPELRGPDQREWRAQLLEDEGNFRAALNWAMETSRAELALRLAGALWMFWRPAGLFAEGRVWLDSALEAGQSCPPGTRRQALWGAGWLAYHQGDYRRTDQLGRELLRLLAGVDDPVHRHNALTLIGSAALAEGRTEVAIGSLREAYALCATSETNWHHATSLLNLGMALLHRAQAADARPLFERAQAMYADLGDRYFTAYCLVKVGYVALVTGHRAGAEEPIRRAMEMFRDLGDAWGIAEGLEAIASLQARSEPRTAAVLSGAAEQLRGRISMRPHPADASINDAFLAVARQALAPDVFAEAWMEGRGLTMHAAANAALF